MPETIQCVESMNERNQYIPFVSIIIPTLNCASHLQGCVQSLRNQDYPEDRFEIIIVDNGSTDATMDILPQTGVRYFVRSERSRAKALNTGIVNAMGEIICTTDISCRAEPDWISTIVKSFKDFSVGCVAGEIKLLKEHDNTAIGFQERSNYMSPMLALKRTRLPYMPFADGANASFRKQLFEKIGLFEESFIKGADVEICYRMFILTDYKLVFNQDAIVWEPGEPTLRALLKQRFRMGIGGNLMRMKYPALFEVAKSGSVTRKAYWSTLHSLKRLGSLIQANTHAAFSRENTAAADMNIRFLMDISQRLGRAWGHWYLKYKHIKPVPINHKALEDFISGGPISSARLVKHNTHASQIPAREQLQ